MKDYQGALEDAEEVSARALSIVVQRPKLTVSVHQNPSLLRKRIRPERSRTARTPQVPRRRDGV